MSDERVTWIVLVDAEHARFVLVRDGQFRTVDRLDSESAHLRSSGLAPDRPGRVFESSGPARHAIAPHTDPHQKAGVRFAHLVAGCINAAAENGAVSRFVLVAPAAVLREVHSKLEPLTAARLARTVSKDLLKVADKDLHEHFPDWPLVLT